MRKITEQEKLILSSKEWYTFREADLDLKIANYDLTKKLEKAEALIKSLKKQIEELAS